MTENELRERLTKFITDDAASPDGWLSDAGVDEPEEDGTIYVRGNVDIHHLVSNVLWVLSHPDDAV